jgi:hypothetical protein
MIRKRHFDDHAQEQFCPYWVFAADDLARVDIRQRNHATVPITPILVAELTTPGGEEPGPWAVSMVVGGHTSGEGQFTRRPRRQSFLSRGDRVVPTSAAR